MTNQPPKKVRVTSLAGKVMLVVFRNQDGVVMMDFLAKGTIITGVYYASLLQKLQVAVKIRMLAKGVRLIQDNAPVSNSHIA